LRLDAHVLETEFFARNCKFNDRWWMSLSKNILVSRNATFLYPQRQLKEQVSPYPKPLSSASVEDMSKAASFYPQFHEKAANKNKWEVRCFHADGMIS
jgi:hypothetical protein